MTSTWTSRLAPAAAALGLALAVPAQPGTSQEELKANFEKKLEGAWLKNAAWHTDYDKAMEAAKSSGKLVFGYFTRSYAY